MRTIITWVVIFVIIVGGLLAQSFPDDSGLYLLSSFWGTAAFITLIVTPIWISASCWMVKNTIRAAGEGNFKAMRFFLLSRGWFIFPLQRYQSIIEILRRLCLDPSTPPSINSGEFTSYIIRDGETYKLTSEGVEKMLKRVNSGWINGTMYERRFIKSHSYGVSDRPVTTQQKWQYWGRFILHVIGTFGPVIFLFIVMRIYGPKQVTPLQGLTGGGFGIAYLLCMAYVASRFWKCPICEHSFSRFSKIGKCEQCGSKFC